MRFAFLLPSTCVRHFSGSHVEINFRLFDKNKMKWKRTDGESAKAVRGKKFPGR